MKPFSQPVAYIGDRHRLDQRERILLHEHAVLERPRLRLVRVADEVVRLRGLARDRLPLGPGRERGAAAAEERRRLHALDHALRPQLARARECKELGLRLRVDALGDAAQELQPRRLRQRRRLSAGSAPRAAPGRRSCAARQARARTGRGTATGCAPSGTVAPASAHERSVHTCSTSGGPLLERDAARRTSRRRTPPRAGRRAGATRSRARPASPSRRAAAPRAARGGGDGGACGRCA